MQPVSRRTDLEQRMHDAVANLSVGEVVSFGDIAAKAGRPRASRAAGRLLASTMGEVPWWRVVYSNGNLPPHNPEVQSEHLLDEGVELKGYRVVRSPFGRFEA